MTGASLFCAPRLDDDLIDESVEDRLALQDTSAAETGGEIVDSVAHETGEALVGVFRSRYLKRFESSIHAFRISIRRALEFQKTFESYLLDVKVLDSRSFHKALQLVERENEEDDATPASRADEMDEVEEVDEIVGGLETVDPSEYGLRRLHEAVQHDIEILGGIWSQVKDMGPRQDLKLQKLKDLLAGPLRGRKVLVFSYYLDTVRYLWRELVGEAGQEFRKSIGEGQAIGAPELRSFLGGRHPQDECLYVSSEGSRRTPATRLIGRAFPSRSVTSTMSLTSLSSTTETCILRHGH